MQIFLLINGMQGPLKMEQFPPPPPPPQSCQWHPGGKMSQQSCLFTNGMHGKQNCGETWPPKATRAFALRSTPEDTAGSLMAWTLSRVAQHRPRHAAEATSLGSHVTQLH